ncbi:EthD family reductase [Kineococcus indalonis]|uniref:EthD family reductase n=1 Tax=Kineococcus indalonis TaxID=2696566 RepID=UPI0014128884|nr:EthD family reductase [Kineococcus indalonis]NAZ84777.1 EthD family reductase [Kineococcus indalonis]
MVALYGQPADPADREQRCTREHVPLAAALRGLRARRAAKVHSAADGSASPCCFVGELLFDDLDAVRTALSSPRGRAASSDFAEPAPPGSLLLVAQEVLDRTS